MGGGNIAVGANAGSALTAGANNIYIGSNGGATESNILRIGSGQTQTYIAGISGVPLSGASVVITSTGQLGVMASSRRYKQNIADLADESDKLARLHPVSYQYKAEPGKTHFGLIAEEVDQVMPEIVVRNQDQQPESVQYQELIPLLLQQAKQQKAFIEKQGTEIERQKAELEAQRKQIAQLQTTLDNRVAQLEDRLKLAGLVASR
jgi:hypothetical protein